VSYVSVFLLVYFSYQMSITVKCEGLSKCLEFKTIKEFAEHLKVLEVETNVYLTKLIQPLCNPSDN
jgi:hypothetical protein